MSSAPQLVVNTTAPKGVPGQSTDNDASESGVNAEASASIPFGVMMQQFAEGQFKLLSGGTNKLAGIAILENVLDRTDQLDTGGVKPKATIAAGRVWRGWVLIEETVAVGDPVRVRHTPATTEQPGAFRTSAQSTNCSDISTFASWRTGGASTDTPPVAELEIDMTNSALADPD